jgi:hypothetical protein
VIDSGEFPVILSTGSAVFVRKASGWVRTAELRHVLTWMLPSQSAWADMPEVKDPEGEPCESKWLADRFLLTFVRDWSTASLHQEHRWQGGEASSNVDPAEVGLRVVLGDKLNAEIALRAVTGDGAEYQLALLSRAVELLESRQFAEAAAMFEGALAVSPTPWVRNCLAFCLVPLEPAAATQVFIELLSEELDVALLRANLAAASRVMGDLDGAWAHAAAGLECLASQGPRPPAFLWRFGESDVYLGEIDLERYLRSALQWSDPSRSGAGDQ